MYYHLVYAISQYEPSHFITNMFFFCIHNIIHNHIYFVNKLENLELICYPFIITKLRIVAIQETVIWLLKVT